MNVEQLQVDNQNGPRVAIVILNWNGLADTKECIHSVCQLTYTQRVIFLIDNASAHGEGARLQDEYGALSDFRVILYDENLGFTGAHNRIISDILEEGFSFIALLNNDTIVDRYWLGELIATAQIHEADVVSSKLINYYDRSKLDNVGHQMLDTGEIVPLGYMEHPDTYSEVVENFGSCGGATLYRCSMIEEIGFFDPYFSTGYEDAEFGARAVLAGYKAVLAPRAVVYHKISKSVNKVRDDRYELMIRDAIWYSYFKLTPKNLQRTGLIYIKFLMSLMANLILRRSKEISYLRTSFRNSFLPRLKNQQTLELKWEMKGHPQDIRARQTSFLGHGIKVLRMQLRNP